MTDDPHKRPKDSAKQPEPADVSSDLDSEATAHGTSPSHPAPPSASPGKAKNLPKDDTAFLEASATKPSNAPPHPPASKPPLDDTAFLEIASTKRDNSGTPPPPRGTREETDFLEAASTKRSNPGGTPPASPAPPAAKTPPPPPVYADDPGSGETQVVSLHPQAAIPTPQTPAHPPQPSELTSSSTEFIEADGTMIFSKPSAQPTQPAEELTSSSTEFIEADGTMIFSKPAAQPPQPPASGSTEFLEADGTMVFSKPCGHPAEPPQPTPKGSTEFLEAGGTMVFSKPPAHPPQPAEELTSSSTEFIEADGTMIFSKPAAQPPQPPPESPTDILEASGTDVIEKPSGAQPQIPVANEPPPSALEKRPLPTPPPAPPVAKTQLPLKTLAVADDLGSGGTEEITRHPSTPPAAKAPPQPPPVKAPAIVAPASIATQKPPPPTPPSAKTQPPLKSLAVAEDLGSGGTEEITRHPSTPPAAKAPPQHTAGEEPTVVLHANLNKPRPQPPAAPTPPSAKTQPPLKSLAVAEDLGSGGTEEITRHPSTPPPAKAQLPAGEEPTVVLPANVGKKKTEPPPAPKPQTPSRPPSEDTKIVEASITRNPYAQPPPKHPNDDLEALQGDSKSGDTSTETRTEEVTPSDFDYSSDSEATTGTPRSRRPSSKLRTPSSIRLESGPRSTSSTGDQLIVFLTERAAETQVKIQDLHWRTGEKIGDANHAYHLIRPLGKGGFGEVWLALDSKDDMQVALKLVNLDDIGLESTRKEIQNNYKLEEFRSFIRIYSDIEYHGWLAISMEFVEGASFSQILKTAAQLCEAREIPRPYFEPEEVRHHVKQLCTALDYLHNLVNRRGKLSPLIHCDIKPANLMVAKPGYGLKVADLGIARQAVSLSMSQSKADPNQGAMALAYGSPQQYDDLTPVAADDIYAVGATIYHLLTGAPPPFNAEKVFRDPTLIQPSMTGQREKIWKVWKDRGHEFTKPEKVPENWERAVAACLAVRREDRPESTLKILEILGLPKTHSTPRAPQQPERVEKPLTFEELMDGSAKEKRFASRYILRERLGKGGMGVVWRAEDRRFKNQMAALKFLKPDVAETILKTELMAKNLVHDHIVKTQDYLEDGDLLAIPMEYVKGGTIEQQLANRKKDGRNFFEVDDLKEWLVQLCDALTYAHNYVPPQTKKKSPIIHRDIKPANLMIGEENDLKILDFGLARKVDQSMAMDTNYNEGLTIAYASPQQADKQNPKVTDDIYSVGASLYHLLTGSVPPWSCKDLLAKRTNPPKQPSITDRRIELYADEPNQRVGKEVPANWERTIASCLNFDPDVRPQSAWEILEMLGLKPRDLRAGSVIFNGQFKLERILEETPEAESWLAFDEKLKANVKLVIFSRELSQKPDFAEKLEKAVARAKVLEGHPHIGQTFGAYYDPKRPLIGVAMEYIHPYPGEDKAREIWDLRPKGADFCEIANIGKYIRQLCETLEFAHKHDVVHQDIQSANLLVDNEGSFVVTAFGLADCVREATGAEIRPPITPAEDIYATGATIYQLLTGSPPFSTERERSTTRRKALPRMQERREQKFLGSGRTGKVPPVPKRWEYAVQRCLDREPAKRPSADELAKLLRPKPKWLYPVAIGVPALLALIFILFFTGGVICSISPSNAKIDVLVVDDNTLKTNLVGHASNYLPKSLAPGVYYLKVSAKGWTEKKFVANVPKHKLWNWSSVSGALDREQGILKITLDPPDFNVSLIQGNEVTPYTAAKLAEGVTLPAADYSLKLTRPFWDDIQTNISFDGASTNMLLRFPHGTLVLPGIPRDATLSLDGHEIADLTRPIQLKPGTDKVSIELTNWAPQKFLVEIKNGVTNRLKDVEFKNGRALFECQPAGVSVSVDGGPPQTIAGTKYEDAEVKPLVKRTYFFTKEGYVSQPREVLLDYGQKTNFSVTLREEVKLPVPVTAVPVRIIITPESISATVQLAGQTSQHPPYDFSVKPNASHPLQITAPGYDPISTQVPLGNEGFTNYYALIRSKGRLHITSAPEGVDYTVQGAQENTASENHHGKSSSAETLSDLPTGPYKVTFTRDGFPSGSINIEVLKDKTAQASFTFAQGTLRLLTGDCPPDAQIFVDNKSVAKNPSGVISMDLPPGQSVSVRATYSGLDDFTTNIAVLDRKTMDCPIVFHAGYIVISSEPQGANLAINNLPVGVTPYTNRFMPPGSFTIVLSKPGFQSYSDTKEVVPGTPQTFPLTLLPAEGSVFAKINLPDTTLLVDGKPRSQNDSLHLAVGQHTFVATNSALGVSQTVVTNVVENQSQTVTFNNLPFATVEIEGQPASAKLSIVYDGGATRELKNGVLNYVKTGSATIKLEADGWISSASRYALKDQQPVKRTVMLAHNFALSGIEPAAYVYEGTNRGASEITLAYGAHKLTATYEGLKGLSFPIEVTEATVKQPIAVPHIPFGKLTIILNPPTDAEIFEGGTRVGNAGRPMAFDPGSHSLTIKPAGHESVPISVAIADGDNLTQKIDISTPVAVTPAAPPPPPPVIVEGALTNSIGMGLLWIPGLPGGAAGYGKSEPGGWVAMYKVTQEDFAAVEGANPSKSTLGNKYPVESMSADEANEFCDKLTARDLQSRRIQAGWKYKLPAKEQWQYIASRAGIPQEKTKLADYAWTIGNSPQKGTSPVGSKGSAPQIPGLYDIAGDVWELTSTPTDTGDGYLVAGGSFSDPVQYVLDNLKGDFAQSLAKDGRRRNTGFRVILVPDKS